MNYLGRGLFLILGEVGVIQRRRAAVSLSTLGNDVKRSVLEKQDGVNISRFMQGD